MNILSHLTVLESRYCYNCWSVDTTQKPYRVFDEIRLFRQRRDTDLYHEENTYSTAEVPFDVYQIERSSYSEDSPYLALPKSCSDLTAQAVASGSGVLMANGYCAYAPALLGGLQRALGENASLGMIWIDAHADNRIIEDKEEEKTRFVGIPVSTAAGQTFDDWRINGCGLRIPLPGSNILASDLRANLPSFDQNAKKAGIQALSSAEFESRADWKKAVTELASRVDALYLSVDADILSPEYIPAYAKIVPNGHSLEKVAENISLVMKTGKVAVYSVFCIDFDLYEQDGETNYRTGKALIEAGLKSWKKVPF